MAQQILNVSTPNSHLGDALRDASIKSNDNFTELYEGKVDKVTGKDLSDNNLTNELVTKINDLEALAQVNVQSDWNENDILADAFIKNKPTQLLASLGYFDYADLATQTTPITVAPNTPTLLTNDTLGVGTDISQPPYAVSSVYDSVTNAFDFTQLSIGDTVDIRVHVKVTTTANNQLYHIDLKGGIGSALEFDNRIFSQYVKTAGEDEQTFLTNLYIGSNDIKDNPTKLFIESTQSCTVKVLGWFVRVFRKSVNVVELSDTIPLSDVLVNGNTTGGTNISISNADAIILDNGANLKKGTTDAGLGGLKGIALRCAVDYELKWEAGRLYVMGGDGFTIREVSHTFDSSPDNFEDETKGFVIGSRWILDNGTVYVCNDPDEGSALWELQSAGVPDATTSVKGKLKLAGDLGGTADLPTVPALANKANDSAVVHKTGDETISGIKTFSSNIVMPSTGTPLILKVESSGQISGLPLANYPSVDELAFVKGVTSAIQTQLDGKLTSASWVDYSATSTIVGWASFTTKIIRYQVIGKTVNVWVYISGVSNSATTSITLNYSASANYTILTYGGGLLSLNNGTSGHGYTNVPISSSNIFTFGYWTTATSSTATWTASGTKSIRGFFSYEID